MTANPTLLSMPLAQNGQKNVIPETQATPGNGLFSQSTGFPAETSLPLGAGGVAPSREDFNGMANLLGGVAFYAQKGFTFNYDATQDYYTSCIVIDPDDGLRYVCVADMSAGTVAPHLDTTNTYWKIFKSGLDADQIPAFNKRDIITTSGTYTAPVTGWYKITVKGGGGGGGGAFSASNTYTITGGGGEGGASIAYEYMTAGTTATVTIGAGGIAGAAGAYGNDGGNSSVIVNSNTYTGGGGKAGAEYSNGGAGGTGTIIGASGQSGKRVGVGNPASGANGGGNGGGIGIVNTGTAGTNGGGGASGGTTMGNAYTAGGDGGDGFAWFEYFDTSLNP